MTPAPTLYVVHALGESAFEGVHVTRESAERHADELRASGVIVVVRSLSCGSRTARKPLPRPRTPWSAR
jgi:hypothetical protein